MLRNYIAAPSTSSALLSKIHIIKLQIVMCIFDTTNKYSHVYVYSDKSIDKTFNETLNSTHYV